MQWCAENLGRFGVRYYLDPVYLSSSLGVGVLRFACVPQISMVFER
jgi:hypothetical protein